LTLVSGRADAAYNRFIIEYEPPHSLRGDLKHSHTAHALEQVKRYLSGLRHELGVEGRRLAGVATDGSFFIFVRMLDEQFYVDAPVAVTIDSTARFLQYILSLNSGVALIPENIIEDFGLGTRHARDITTEFYRAFSCSNDALVTNLFEQWRVFFAEATGYEAKTGQLKRRPQFATFIESLGIDRAHEPDIAKIFFSLQSYYAILIKLLAWLFASRVLMVRRAMPLAALSNLDSATLLSRLRDMEDGGIFRTFGIRNFLEADFFGWYTHAWTDELGSAINPYDTAYSRVRPTNSRRRA
jgi:hypothetical protein